MDRPRSRSMGPCKALLIRYRVIVILALLFLALGYWRSSQGLTLSAGFEDVNGQTGLARQQQILSDAGAVKLSMEENAPQTEMNTKLIVKDTSGLNEDMNRDVHYALNSPNTCIGPGVEGRNESRKVFLLIYIVSTTDKYAQRMRIRNTWGSVTQYSNMAVRSVFVINDVLNASNKKDRLVWDALKFESSTFGDLIQEDYTTLRKPKKTGGAVEVLRSWADLLALRWISKFCNDAQFILRTEDDVFVNLYSLMNHLLQLYAANFNNQLLMCDVHERSIISKDKNKPGGASSVSPPVDEKRQYCSTVSFICSRDVAAALLEASYYAADLTRSTDEYYITSILPSLLGPQPLLLTSMSQAYCIGKEMSAYVHETEWYKYLFSRVEYRANINFVHIWRGLTVRASTGVIPQPQQVVPGVLADDYIPRNRLLIFRTE